MSTSRYSSIRKITSTQWSGTENVHWYRTLVERQVPGRL